MRLREMVTLKARPTVTMHSMGRGICLHLKYPFTIGFRADIQVCLLDETLDIVSFVDSCLLLLLLNDLDVNTLGIKGVNWTCSSCRKVWVLGILFHFLTFLILLVYLLDCPG